MANKTLDQTPLITSMSDNDFVAVSVGDKMKHITKAKLLEQLTGLMNVIKSRVDVTEEDIEQLQYDLTAGLATKISNSQKGIPNGVATLDGNGKVPTSQMTINGTTFMGSWNPATNIPTLTNGTGAAGQYYQASTLGSRDFGQGVIEFAKYDKVIYGGGIWQKYVDYRIQYEDYATFAEVQHEGPIAIITVLEDEGGDGTESVFIRYNDKLFNIPAVEI